MSLGYNRPDALPRNGKGNKKDLPVMSCDSIAPIGEFNDVEFNRLRTGLGRPLQYQLSFRSAGG